MKTEPKYRFSMHKKILDQILMRCFAPSIRRIFVSILCDYHSSKPMTSYQLHDLIGWTENFLRCHRFCQHHYSRAGIALKLANLPRGGDGSNQHRQRAIPTNGGIAQRKRVTRQTRSHTQVSPLRSIFKMNESVKSSSKRLMLYYARVIDSLDKEDRAGALAHLSELHLIAKRLWTDISKDSSFSSPPAK